MNRKFLILVTILTIVCTTIQHQAFAQSMENKSNGILEIISLHIPDSIIFKPAEGVEIKSWTTEVSLVSDTNSFRHTLMAAEGSMKLSPEGRFIYIDKTEKVIPFFNVPSDFEAQIIKFVVEGNEMYFDINKLEWVREPEITFDASQYIETSLKQLYDWGKDNSEGNGKFKATVYYMVTSNNSQMLQDDYFFSDVRPGADAVLVQFKSKMKLPAMEKGQKVIIYFNAVSKNEGSESVIEHIELIDDGQ